MTTITTPSSLALVPSLKTAWQKMVARLLCIPPGRSYDGHEVALPTWRAPQAEDWLGRWAMNLMLINVSTHKLRRAVRLPGGRSAGHCWGGHLEVSGLARAGRVDGV
jgi:hypothetical protein